MIVNSVLCFFTLTPRCTVFYENSTVAKLVEKVPTFMKLKGPSPYLEEPTNLP